jgi:muconolactone delta-isomerase
MKFLAMSKRLPGVIDAQVMAQADAEALAVFKHMQSGAFDQIHFSRDWKGAVLFVHAASRDAALAILAELPMVRERCITFDLYELAPFDHYQRLFKDQYRAAP